MATVYYPKLRPTDYDTFRRAQNSDLPGTYNEWFDLARKEMRQFIVSGDTVIEVEIDPDELIAYCHGARNARTLDGLKKFAPSREVAKVIELAHCGVSAPARAAARATVARPAAISASR